MLSKVTRNLSAHRRLTLLMFVVLAAGIFAGLELTGVTHVFNKKPVTVASGSSFNTKGEKMGSTDNRSGDQSSGTTNSSYSASGKLGGTAAALVTPSGDFVSNHHPNLGGSPTPNTMSSVCNTTPGASCTISFTKSGVMKSLTPQTADPNGFTNWNWKLQDIGLTAGTWSIRATASLGGQTKSASDAMDLVVAP